jgi:hypothetical protein
LTIVLGEVFFKLLCSEVDDEIDVPRIIRGDVKEMFVWEVGIEGGTGSIGRKFHNEFGKYEGFLALGCGKFEVVLLKDEDPSGKFAINFLATEQVVHWVGIYDDFGSSKKDVMAQFLDCKDNYKGEFLFMIVFQGWP